jgi:hypothetical protein
MKTRKLILGLADLLPESFVELLVQNKGRKDFHRWCLETVVQPNMEYINTITEQENDPEYITYLLEYFINKEV